MIAIDTSSFVAYFSGAHGQDVEAVDLALEQKIAVLPPVVLSELLSDPKLNPSLRSLIKELPQLLVLDDYWERVGTLRSKIFAKGLKAKLADCLIAQSCIDHQVPLITRDKDFRHLVRFGGLKLSVDL